MLWVDQPQKQNIRSSLLDPDSAKLLIIAMSALIVDSIIKKGIAVGFDDFSNHHPH